MNKSEKLLNLLIFFHGNIKWSQKTENELVSSIFYGTKIHHFCILGSFQYFGSNYFESIWKMVTLKLLHRETFKDLSFAHLRVLRLLNEERCGIYTEIENLIILDCIHELVFHVLKEDDKSVSESVLFESLSFLYDILNASTNYLFSNDNFIKEYPKINGHKLYNQNLFLKIYKRASSLIKLYNQETFNTITVNIVITQNGNPSNFLNYICKNTWRTKDEVRYQRSLLKKTILLMLEWIVNESEDPDPTAIQSVILTIMDQVVRQSSPDWVSFYLEDDAKLAQLFGLTVSRRLRSMLDRDSLMIDLFWYLGDEKDTDRLLLHWSRVYDDFADALLGFFAAGHGLAVVNRLEAVADPGEDEHLIQSLQQFKNPLPWHI